MASGQLYNLSGLQFLQMIWTRAVMADISYGKNRITTLIFFFLGRLFVGSQDFFYYVYHILLHLSYILTLKDGY